jgi:hypothetical protein
MNMGQSLRLFGNLNEMNYIRLAEPDIWFQTLRLSSASQYETRNKIEAKIHILVQAGQHITEWWKASGMMFFRRILILIGAVPDIWWDG